MGKRRWIHLKLTATIAAMLVCSVDCAGALHPAPLYAFDTCAELEDYLAEQLIRPTRPQLAFRPMALFVGCAAPASGEGEADGLGRIFTTTNTQELGVDEPDIVKNDGELLFVIADGKVHALAAWPPEDLDHLVAFSEVVGTPRQLLYAASRLLVVSDEDVQRGSRTVLSLFDVTDPAAPTLLRRTRIDGSTVSLRRVGDEVMVVTQAPLETDVELVHGFFRDEENRERIDAVGIDGMFPKVRDQIIGVDERERLENASSCSNTYAAAETEVIGMVLVHALSLLDETAPIRATGVISAEPIVYASTESVVLASIEHRDGGYFTPAFVQTRVHQLAAFQGAGAATYRGTGAFYGEVKSDLSFDDKDGLIRMVVSDDGRSFDDGEGKTVLLVIEEQGGALVEVGRVDGIGKGETVQAVRFLDDYGYVVTYPTNDEVVFDDEGNALPTRQIDPLFVIDLRDPRAPRLRGTLEVEGYSTYLHPIDAGRLLAIGVRTNPTTGDYLGLSLSVFDVADPDHPTLMNRLAFGDGNTSSEALVERHAFTYFAPDRALVIPVVETVGAELVGNSSVFSISPEGTILQVGAQTFAAEPDVALGCRRPRRNVIIKDVERGSTLYALSADRVQASALDRPAELVASASLTGGAGGDCEE